MRKTRTKSKVSTELQLLQLLKKVLPKATEDAKLAGKIYTAIEQELQVAARATAFDKFCAHCEVPDLEAKTVSSVQEQFAAAFAEGDITLKPNRKEKTLAVEIALPDGTQFSSEIQVRPSAAEPGEDPEFKPKFVPFPVVLPGDKELVWMLGRGENLAPHEAGIQLAKVEEDFWGSKTGQKLIRDRVERCFAEFIARAPAGMLNEVGLKRHYKTAEALKVLRPALRA